MTLDEKLFLIKGLVAFSATCLLLWHMCTTEGDMSLGRIFRYVALLAASSTITYGSTEQVREHVQIWETVHTFSLITALLVFGAGLFSILEDRGHPVYIWKRVRR